MKKVFLLLTLIAATFSAWGAYDNLYVVGAGTFSSGWEHKFIQMYKTNNVWTYTGYFYKTSTTNGIKIANNTTDYSNCYHPAGGSTVALTRGQSYNLTTTGNDTKWSIPEDGWYTITVDQTSGSEKLTVSAATFPATIYPAGHCFKSDNGWSSTTMNETSSGSGIYEKYIDFKTCSGKELKFGCMNGYDKSLVGSATTSPLITITGPSTYDAKHYTRYTAQKASSATSNDNKYKITLTSDATYFVRVTLKNPTDHKFKLEIKQKPTLAFTSNPNNVAYTADPFNVTVNTNSGGTLTYSSSNPNVASIDANGKVTLHVPGTTTITVKRAEDANYGPLSINYTLTVTGTVPTYIKKESSTITALKAKLNWSVPPAKGNEYSNFAINDVLTFSYGKHLYENISGIGTTDMLRYYYQTSQYASGSLTIRAKAGVIIQSVILTYSAGSNSVFSDEYCYGESAAEGHKVESGVPFKVDANSVTFYNSLKDKTKSGGGINVTGYEITYFDPSEGVAVTKTLFDLAKNPGLKDNTCYQNIALNEAINIHADNTGTMRYSNSGFIACYRWTGSIDINARKGATIHYVKVTYVQIPKNATEWFTGVLSTKSTTGSAVAVADRIASDSVIFVNSNSLKLYVGNTNGSDGRIGITKIYVNYTDGSDVVVDNFDNCGTKGSTEPVSVVGVNDKINWSIEKFTRDSTNRMYYDQSIKLNKGGKIYTPIVGALDEVAFDWHPTEANKNIKFYVKAGGTTYTVDSAAAKMDKVYTINFKKASIQNNDTFAIMVDANSGTALEIGHVSIKPVLTYAANAVSINAEAYQSEDWKYTNNTLINNTGATASYSITDSPDVAVIDTETGQVTIKGEGTVAVTAEAGDKSASYNLTINLKDAKVAFAKKDTSVYLSEGSYTPVVSKSTTANLFYEFIGDHEGATIDSETGKVEFTTADTYIIKASAPLTLPYKEGADTLTLTVNDKPLPGPKFESSSLTKDRNDGPFTNTLSFTQEVGTGAGLGDTTYVSSNEAVAEVDDNGEVTIKGAGTAMIKARLAEGTSFAADSAEYSLTVLPLPEMSFAESSKSVYLNASPFTNTLTISDGAGTVSYESSDTAVAIVNATSGQVTVKKGGFTTITAKSLKSVTYSAGSFGYNLTVSSLKMPTASFAQDTVYKNQNDGPFTNTTLQTTSDGAKTYKSSDERVATVDENGLVTMGEKPGQTVITVKIAASDTWEKVETQYTLNVSSAPIEDMKVAKNTVGGMKGEQTWADGSQHPNLPIDEKITLSDGKYYPTTKGGEFRYYFASSSSYMAGQFTIQAKAGVIIQSVKLTYSTGNDNMVLSNTYTSGNVAAANQIISGNTYKVDANAVTFYAGKKAAATGNTHINVTDYEITYFDPSDGVAVTKSAADLATDFGLANEQCSDTLAINQAISIYHDITDSYYLKKTLRYYTSNEQFNLYVHTKGIDIKAREGAKIHYVKITYVRNYNGVLTKYWGTNGYAIPDVDCIASDSIIYVNADSIRLYAGTTNETVTSGQYPSIGIKKIYVNYTDNSQVVVDNFDNCDQTSGDSVAVEGVDGKYNWTFKNFSRKDTITNRMYYDQSVLINKGGKISTQYTGGLKELAFDWHPSEKNKKVKFTVKAGDETYTVDSTMANTYTINFNKQNIKSNGEFSIAVDDASVTTLEVGHISLTPYIIYTDNEVSIAAIDYKDAGWKYTNNTLINYTGQDVEYSTSNASIASVDASTGEVTIQTGGTVTISATAGDVAASYQLTINLEATEVEFAEAAVAKLLSVGSYTQPLTLTTAPELGNTVTYSLVGDHDGADVDQDGKVTFTKAGIFTVKGKLEQNLPYAADYATYTLTVNSDPATPQMSFAKGSKSVYLNADPFTNALTVTKGDGAISYESGDTNIATVDDDGLVTIKGAGTTTITAKSAATEAYVAGSTYYTLEVFSLKMPTAAYTTDVVNKNQNDAAFTNTTLKTESDGVKTYESSDTRVATVNATTGEVTMGEKPGTTTIKVKIDASTTWEKIEASYTLNVSSAPIADIKKVVGNIATLGETYGWQSGDDDANCYLYFKINDVISVSSAAGNAKFLKDGDGSVLRYYQNTNKGEFTIRAKAGMIIKAVKIDYANNGVITNVWSNEGKSVPEANQVKSGIPFKVDGNTVTLYVGSTDDVIGKQVRISNIEVSYFDPSEYSTVTKRTTDMAYNYGWTNEMMVASAAINNAVSLVSDDMKYYTNTGCLHSYGKTGSHAIDVVARPGTKIQYVKFTYTNNNGGVLTKYWGNDGLNIAPEDQIASDSILYVNADSVRLYVGSTLGNVYQGTVYISRVYVVYTDSTAVVDNLNKCTALYGGATPTNVAGVDGTFNWKITEFNRDSLRRMVYDQSTMLRNGGKIVADNAEGGVKEVSFDWFATNKDKEAKFYVKAGGETFTVDSSAMGNYYFINYIKTGIKKNGAFSIEVDANQEMSFIEVGHISLTPYLLYTTKEADGAVGVAFQMAPQIDNRDDETAITYSIESGEGTIKDGKVIPANPGDMVIKATWGDVSTTYTLHVTGKLTLNEDDEDNSARIAAHEDETLDVEIGRNFTAGTYNTICLPFNVSKDDLATAFNRTISSLATYTSTAALDGTRKNLDVVIEEVETVEAGKPYLLQFEGENVSRPIFEQVTIVNTTGATIEGETADFIGAIGKTQIGKNEKSILFVVAGNRLAWNNTGADTYMNGFRAHFYVEGMNAQSGVAPRLVFRQPQIATGMDNLNDNNNTRKMIINNQLIIIRNGVRYNANGQMLKMAK